MWVAVRGIDVCMCMGVGGWCGGGNEWVVVRGIDVCIYMGVVVSVCMCM